MIGFGYARAESGASIWFDEPANAIVFDFDFDDAPRGRISLKGLRLRGRHNISNAMAASAAALALGVKPEEIERALASFRGLPHRIEVVHENRGVTYIDDSKGTNVGAVVEAIDALAAPIVLIAGGLDKGGDYTPLQTAARREGQARDF